MLFHYSGWLRMGSYYIIDVIDDYDFNDGGGDDDDDDDPQYIG